MTKLTLHNANYSIGQLYNCIAISLGLSINATYDCTKVLVSSKIQKDIFKYYESQGASSDSYAMWWVCFGPKVAEHLKEYEVEVMDGWYKPDDKED